MKKEIEINAVVLVDDVFDKIDNKREFIEEHLDCLDDNDLISEIERRGYVVNAKKED